MTDERRNLEAAPLLKQKYMSVTVAFPQGCPFRNLFKEQVSRCALTLIDNVRERRCDDVTKFPKHCPMLYGLILEAKTSRGDL